MTLHKLYRKARRIVVLLIGGTVLLVGVVLLVTPGPAFVVIPVGLGILAIEFSWARRWLRKVRDLVEPDDEGTPPPHGASCRISTPAQKGPTR